MNLSTIESTYKEEIDTGFALKAREKPVKKSDELRAYIEILFNHG